MDGSERGRQNTTLRDNADNLTNAVPNAVVVVHLVGPAILHPEP